MFSMLNIEHIRHGNIQIMSFVFAYYPHKHVSRKDRMKDSKIFRIVRFLFLLICLVICILQSHSEIQIYLQHQIYTATSIEQFDEAKVNLVFCDTQPYTNHSATVEDLKNHIIRLILYVTIINPS